MLAGLCCGGTFESLPGYKHTDFITMEWCCLKSQYPGLQRNCTL